MTEELRIEFIRTRIPNFMKINPYLDTFSVKEVRGQMRDSGLYRTRVEQIEISSIINLILKAQGKRPYRQTAINRATRRNEL